MLYFHISFGIFMLYITVSRYKQQLAHYYANLKALNHTLVTRKVSWLKWGNETLPRFFSEFLEGIIRPPFQICNNSMIHRENAGTHCKYPLYKLYMGLIIKGTILRGPQHFPYEW